MAVTSVLSGSLSLVLALRNALMGDLAGAEQSEAFSYNLSFTDNGGTEPDLYSVLSGTLATSTTPASYALIAASAPFGVYFRRAPVSGADRIKVAAFANLDAVNSITVARAAANGVPLFDTNGDSITLPPGGAAVFYYAAGIAVLTTGSNDSLTVTASAGTPNLLVVIGYGR